MDVRSQPTGITGGDPRECTWPCRERPPRGGREARAGDKGVARGARAQGGAQGSRGGRDSPSQRLGCAPRGAEGLRAAAAARRRAGAPWWRARGGGCRRRAAEDGGRAGGRSRAAEGGSLSEAGARARSTVRGAAAGGGDLREARRAPQFVGAAPSPRRRAGGVSKGRTLRRG